MGVLRLRIGGGQGGPRGAKRAGGGAKGNKLSHKFNGPSGSTHLMYVIKKIFDPCEVFHWLIRPPDRK